MFQQSQTDQFADHKLQLAQTEAQKIFKLPAIEQPQLRPQTKTRNESRIPLPSIQQAPVSPPVKVSPPHRQSERQQVSLKEGFALQIEERLKMVLDNVNHGQEQEQPSDEDDFDFQAIVNQNKEILKQHKHKNDAKPTAQSNNNLVEDKDDSKPSNKSKSKTLKNHSRNESLYERKIKEYRDVSVENKYIQKKKELLANKHENDKNKKAKEEALALAAAKAKQIQTAKPKEELGGKAKEEPGSKPKDNEAMFVKASSKIPPRQPRESRAADKPSSENVRADSNNLFDNIQNFLENPRGRILDKDSKRPVGQSIKKLEEKITIINEKLGINEDVQEAGSPSESMQELAQRTIKDWRRMEVGKTHIDRVDSNFDKEVERISSLQEKNRESLNQFVEQQKFLLELTLMKQLLAKSLPVATKEKAG